ncbi:MAG: hypothetical protein US11_C0005G0036 [Candidatus Roizmanbacteria bacterium GW2011_GWA2_36_23]|uniref:Uncharacterized protein n=1 Tax=Candidatus Roizmanbacteria bacterium GW2011_GWA2_36_23 TaxID=1618480 RepID=A0A0G0EKS3_9BACT|nr:MAG: hypothetical protein US11_C0005G0036 [Candidatus Roizmanbacteria bacterium GW2011_GWA2_36_23]
MSLRAEHTTISQDTRPAFAIESLDDIPGDGFIFPLSVAIGQNGSMRLPPYPQDIYRITQALFDCLPRRDGITINNRGSTLPYTLLMPQAERRGPINYAVFNNMRDDLEDVRGSRIWNVLTNIPFGSDTDLFIEGTDRKNFEAYKKETVAKVNEKVTEQRGKKKFFNRNPHNTNTTESVLAKIGYWLDSINGLRHENPFNTNRQAVVVDIKQAEIYGIPFMDLIIKHTPVTLEIIKDILRGKFDFTDDNIFQRIGNVYFAIGDWTTEDPKNSPLEDRRDRKYSLPWDACTFGTVMKWEDIDQELKERIIQRTQKANQRAESEVHKGKKRTVFVEGVAAPRNYGQQIEDEFYFQFPKESLETLCRPLTVEEGIFDLSATRQFMLALRAAQKGAMYEELMNLTPEGKEALQSNRRAKAINPEALEIFNKISVEQFRSEIATMTADEKRQLNEYAMKYMLTGIFYPQRFLGYALETGVLRFFQNLSYINADNIDNIINRLTPWDDYVRSMHKAVYFDDASRMEKDWTAMYLEECQRRSGFENPYLSVVKAIFEEGLIPAHVDTTTNYLPILDQLLELDPEAIEQQIGKMQAVYGDAGPKERQFKYSTLIESVPLIARGGFNPDRLKLYEKEIELEKKAIPVFGALGLLGLALTVNNLITPGADGWETFLYLNINQASMVLYLWLQVVSGKRKFQINQYKSRNKSEELKA